VLKVLIIAVQNLGEETLPLDVLATPLLTIIR